MRKIISSLAILILQFSLLNAPTDAAEPTLARLAFWVPPERMSEFEAVYAESVQPVLDRIGLFESLRPGRATIDSVHSKLLPARGRN
jgi:hypothetical protein